MGQFSMQITSILLIRWVNFWHKSTYQIGFIDKNQIASTQRKQELAALLEGIPKSKVGKNAAFFVDEDCSASVLFDDDSSDEYLAALEDMDHIETFYLVTADNALFKKLKDEISEMLEPLQITEEEKRPLSAGFEANLVYFKLDFLEADETQLGNKFAELLPMLWLTAGAKGTCPTWADNQPYLIPYNCPFAVLLDENYFLPFKKELKTRPDMTHVFIATHSEEGFKAMCAELPHQFITKQLYQDYLEHFRRKQGQGG